MKAADVLKLVEQVDDIYASKGKSVVHFDLRKQKPDTDVLLSALLGPTGNLRAPTLRKGRTLVVGFEQGTYEKLLS